MSDYIPAHDDDGNHCFIPKTNLEAIGFDRKSNFYFVKTKDGRKLRVSPEIAGEYVLVQI